MMKFNLLLALSLVMVACGGNTSSSTNEDETEAVVEEKMVEMEEAPKDIVELAVATESLSTLVAAVQAGGLVETLQGKGPFTVFAPTNDAFAALPEGTLDELLKTENKEQLVAILTYHVIAGKVLSSELVDGMSVETVNGKTVQISLGEGAMVNEANVTAADVEASNGVVHVIDAVILPPAE